MCTVPTCISHLEILHVSNTSRKHAASSPIPIERCKPHRQTLTELASPHTNMASPVGLLRHCGELSLDDIDATDHPSSRPNISLTNFLPLRKRNVALLTSMKGYFAAVYWNKHSHIRKVVCSVLNCIQREKRRRQGNVLGCIRVNSQWESWLQGHPIKVVENL